VLGADVENGNMKIPALATKKSRLCSDTSESAQSSLHFCRQTRDQCRL